MNTTAAHTGRGDIGLSWAQGEPPGAYAPPSAPWPIDLALDANEGAPAGIGTLTLPAHAGADVLRRYPGAGTLEALIAARAGIDPGRVLVTAGGDEAIDRACRVALGPGRRMVLPVPTFEMIERYAQGVGAEIVRVPWPSGPFPADEVLRRTDDSTAMIGVVSPNNPTGGVASAEDLARVSAGARGALVMVDLAYAEFADEDLGAAAIALPNAIIIRTFSKAFGLAGIRVGYAIGPERVIRAMRAAGSPFPVSGTSLLVASEALRTADAWLPESVARVREMRRRLAAVLVEIGAEPVPSQANFVLAEFRDAAWVWRALASLGIGVRSFASRPGLERSLRITCPPDDASWQRLHRALHAAARPRALVLDLDVVGAASDWPARLARRLPVETVTDRDAASLPGPAAVRATMTRLGVEHAWMIAGSPASVRAARAAGVPAVGVAMTGDEGRAALEAAGAARVVDDLTRVEEMLP
ncbi:MAG: aminotransferase class I/II-fold pyridoxal phosphate-dependent enzyme [Planctomycetota bacterium]|nr:aminotransferase class I/II-fold pyridoxal phosphate-dependent enzyme [Planctomycetota bacterium]